MMQSRWKVAAIAVGMFAAGFTVRGTTTPAVAHAQPADRVFELRTYTTNPGKLEALKTRFRDHTIRLFERHGMTNIGYWIPMDAPGSENTLIYILAHKDREAAKKSWADFRADPEWQKVAKESEKDGRILVKSPESVFLTPADFSKIK
jgi:NIPSNAP